MSKQIKWSFLKEETCFSGVIKIAEKVKKDISLVTGYYPDEYVGNEKPDVLVIYGTIGRSESLCRLEDKGLISLDKIRGKREVYGFFVLEEAEDAQKKIVIAGSDKRGTIYGLFHLSELMGVSPLVAWNHVIPERKSVYLTRRDTMISKEPSVRYRGFFINDEWPAFGNWATEHFGGINAACYEQVFELLLRLKGNYLWPAMWASNFNLDGPGLKSAELADEYGVVMSTSHHEPCMRAGEEFNLYKGEDSPYGTQWNFRTNEEGITNFWRDGLLRNKKFENVITMGMRGERDSAILGKDATIKDNVELLRDVLRTQNRLIRETISEDLDKVPRQMVLFTEVEEFFYGDDETEGLINDTELDGITLMLSDNNFGYTRTLPTESMRNHKGGFGMYYHMDMHGGAHSYQWIGSTFLPRVWEQMTQAYAYGVREIWVTNIGDIGTQEYGLSFFLDMAYDIEKWGGEECSITKDYTRKWADIQFRAAFTEKDRKRIVRLMWGYTSLLAKRKHEIMNADIYHPLHYGEAEQILAESEFLLTEAKELRKVCAEEHLSAFISLLYYPVCGTANLMKMWIQAGRNKLYAKQNRVETNFLAEEIEYGMKEDVKLIADYETVDGGYYKGFGNSLHIGFVNWNDEDCKAPVRHLIYPAKEPRMLVTRPDREEYSTGLIWCDHKQTWKNFLREDVTEIVFCLVNGSDKSYYFEIDTDCVLLLFSKVSGTVSVREDLTVSIVKDKVIQAETVTFHVKAFTNETKDELLADATVDVMVKPGEILPYSAGTFVERDGYISFRGVDYVTQHDVKEGHFRKMEPYGRIGSAIKVFPATADFYKKDNRPYVEYSFAAEREGEYYLRFYLSPTTPVVFERVQYLGYSINESLPVEVNTVENETIPFFLSSQWEKEAKDNCKIVEQKVTCKAGENHLRFYGMNPGIILEKVVLWPVGTQLLDSYLGPNSSYRIPLKNLYAE